MDNVTLGDVRRTGARLKVECIRCGAVESRDAAKADGSDSLLIAELGLTLVCSSCGARACIASGCPRDGEG